MKYLPFLFLLVLSGGSLLSQQPDDYAIELEPVAIPGLPGMHSFVQGHHGSKWVFLGGRLDGLHARQPFNAFPASQNNTSIYVLDTETFEWWSSSLSTISDVQIREQLQSSNMVFCQVGDTLLLAGGYAFSATANDHITFPYVSVVSVPELIERVISQSDLDGLFHQQFSNFMAVTGGQIGYSDGVYYLVGGHRFDGRYNPMGNPTYTQTYTNGVRKFQWHLEGETLALDSIGEIMDEFHLHRRDYNLLPLVSNESSSGFIISSGVFQPNADLPYLYPVEISESGVNGIVDFSQYLANYHCPNFGLHSAEDDRMHYFFFGGMSQYFMSNGELTQDALVPFTKTISRVVRQPSGEYAEYADNAEMPGWTSAAGSFLHHADWSISEEGALEWPTDAPDTLVAGYVFGGIESSALNPFSSNNTNQTSANNQLYRVKMIRSESAVSEEVNQLSRPALTVYPSPSDGEFTVRISSRKVDKADMYVLDVNGKMILKESRLSGDKWHLQLPETCVPGVYSILVIINGQQVLRSSLVKK